MNNKELEKLLSCEQFKPKKRFLVGLTLASLFHTKGRLAFIQNAGMVGFHAEEISAMLAEMTRPDNLPNRPGYTPEA